MGLKKEAPSAHKNHSSEPEEDMSRTKESQNKARVLEAFDLISSPAARASSI